MKYTIAILEQQLRRLFKQISPHKTLIMDQQEIAGIKEKIKEVGGFVEYLENEIPHTEGISVIYDKVFTRLRGAHSKHKDVIPSGMIMIERDKDYLVMNIDTGLLNKVLKPVRAFRKLQLKNLLAA